MAIDENLIAEINALAHKSKAVGLNEEEKARQQVLRQEYLAAFRSGFKQQLKSVKVVDEMGNDITPEKLKREKNVH